MVESLTRTGHRRGRIWLGVVLCAVVVLAFWLWPRHQVGRPGPGGGAADVPTPVSVAKAERFEDGHVWIGEPARTGPSSEPEERG